MATTVSPPHAPAAERTERLRPDDTSPSAAPPSSGPKPKREPKPGLISLRPQAEARAKRLISLDAFRGFIMITLAARGFGLASLEGDPNFGWLAAQFRHVEWEGMVFWDLIQPAFMFMVGLSMPFAFRNRTARGASSGELTKHMLWRVFWLLALSQIFISIGRGALNFQLINVLAQIALTYLVCFWIMKLPFRGQAIAAALILAGHWALFALFPGSEGAFSKADNVGAVIDGFLGLNYSGYYVTINFVSSTVTTLAGVWAGYLMIGEHTHRYRMKVLAVAIAACFLAGFALEPFNPMVKRIWTASFTFASTGWVLLMLLGFYWLVEIKGFKKVTFPLVVVGMNSIFIYGVHMILHGWLDRAVGVFTFGYDFLGTWADVAQTCTVFLVIWYLCYWLYQRRIFLRI